jgi:hypothetical protein
VTFAHTHARTNITRKALKFGAILEKIPNSNAPALRLVNGPAGRDNVNALILSILNTSKYQILNINYTKTSLGRFDHKLIRRSSKVVVVVVVPHILPSQRREISITGMRLLLSSSDLDQQSHGLLFVLCLSMKSRCGRVAGSHSVIIL